MSGIILFLLGFLLGLIFDNAAVLYSRKRKKFSVFGLRIHHTVYGLLFIMLGFFAYTFFLFGFGLGIIFWHTTRLKKLVFVER